MIFPTDYTEINESLEQTRKAVIGIGCSFVAGMGAWPTAIFSEFDVTVDESKGNRCVLKSKLQEEQVSKLYNLKRRFGAVDYSLMERDNAFTHILANKYLQGTHTPINLGMSGNGNRSSLSNLYLHPNIDWDKIEGGIIVYCPSGKERFDFANDEGIDHGFNFITMWPNRQDNKEGKEYNRDDLAGGYGAAIYSDKFTTIEQITYAQMIVQFAKLHNMQLIVIPGFDERYSREAFKESLYQKIQRDSKGRRIYSDIEVNNNRMSQLLDIFPWDNMFKPQGVDTFIDLCLKQEGLPPTKNASYFFDYLHKGSPNWWVSPCAHPSAKGHDLLAAELFNHITENQHV